MRVAALCCVVLGSALGCATGEGEAPAVTDGALADAPGDTTIETSIPETSADSPVAMPSCTNGTRDGDETDRDCGGSCSKCGVGLTCATATDCTSASCGSDGVCGCLTLDDCPTDTSCIGRLCRPAKETCAATRAAYSSADGEYWIKPVTGASYRAYCDMKLEKEICTEKGLAVSGKTRDGAALTWSAIAKLEHATGLCALWAIKGPMGYPFDDLKMVAGQTLTTCQALGFKADGVIANCPYGASRTDCGFAPPSLNRYGNSCTGCTLNDGDFRDYLLQGPISVGGVMSNVSGTIKTTCKFRL